MGNPHAPVGASGAAPKLRVVDDFRASKLFRCRNSSARTLPLAIAVPTLFIVMAHSRKGGRRPRPEPTPVSGPLGRYFAMFCCRGNRIMQLEQLGPTVTASTPEELAANTKLVMEREGHPDGEVN